MGKLAFYGDENGKESGWGRDYYRARDDPKAADDPFAIHLEDEPSLKALYADAENKGEFPYHSHFIAELADEEWLRGCRC